MCNWHKKMGHTCWFRHKRKHRCYHLSSWATHGLNGYACAMVFRHQSRVIITHIELTYYSDTRQPAHCNRSIGCCGCACGLAIVCKLLLFDKQTDDCGVAQPNFTGKPAHDWVIPWFEVHDNNLACCVLLFEMFTVYAFFVTAIKLDASTWHQFRNTVDVWIRFMWRNHLTETGFKRYMNLVLCGLHSNNVFDLVKYSFMHAHLLLPWTSRTIQQGLRSNQPSSLLRWF